jgi:tetratricopeptide (TPR) repeat protein
MNSLPLTKSPPEVGGVIKFYGIDKWWTENFSEQERELIRNKYQPMISGVEYGEYALDKGECKTSQSILSFLSILPTWFNRPKYYSTVKKILVKAEEEYFKNNNIMEKHFACWNFVTVYYRNRETAPEALEKAIYYCKEQIRISEQVKPIFLYQQPPYKLPRHPGYQQLVIIYEKQGKYKEALELLEKAISQGWNVEDFKKRIERINKKLKV